MAWLDFFKKAEQKVEVVIDEIESIATGPIVSELLKVANLIESNINNSVVVLALIELGIPSAQVPIMVANILTKVQIARVLITQVEQALQQKAAAAKAQAAAMN